MSSIPNELIVVKKSYVHKAKLKSGREVQRVYVHNLVRKNPALKVAKRERAKKITTALKPLTIEQLDEVLAFLNKWAPAEAPKPKMRWTPPSEQTDDESEDEVIEYEKPAPAPEP
jgi:hypothetical protein